MYLRKIKQLKRDQVKLEQQIFAEKEAEQISKVDPSVINAFDLKEADVVRKAMMSKFDVATMPSPSSKYVDPEFEFFKDEIIEENDDEL